MLKTSDEILLLGSFDLIVTEIFFHLDSVLWQYSPLFRFEKIIYIVQIICLIYLFCLTFMDLKFFRYLVKGHTSLTYYLKSVGWIPYIYMLGIGIYLWNVVGDNMAKFEDLLRDYPISLILVAGSLVIAWVRKHPRFLAE
jgi:hypothetical protein